MINKIISILLFFVFFGCNDNYEMKETGGKLYRLNKRTGDIDLVEGQSITRVQKKQSPKDSASMHREFDSLWKKYSAPKEGATAQDYLAEVRTRRRIHEAPPSGTIKEGYRFLGGDPVDSTRWEPIKTILDTMDWKPGEKRMIGKYPVRKLTPWDTTAITYKKVWIADKNRFDVLYRNAKTGEWENDSTKG
jgi:hypothetical protein